MHSFYNLSRDLKESFLSFLYINVEHLQRIFSDGELETLFEYRLSDSKSINLP
jgi:hypothetical protein